MKQPKITAVRLQMIINGHAELIKGKMAERLVDVCRRALDSSGNIGRPLEDWQIRDANGVLLENARTIKDFGFTPDTRLFLNLGVGAGG